MSAGEATAGRDWESLARAASSRRRGDEEEVEVQRELLTFKLADSPYAIPVENVREIVRLREITPMPRVPSEILGVISLRGEVVQVVDLRRRLSLACSEPTRRTRVIVLHGEDDRVTGVLVDAVRDVIRVGESALRPATAAEGESVSDLCVRGEEFVSILDLERVLDFRAER